MTLKEKQRFKSLMIQRFLIGSGSTLFHLVIVYLLLCIDYTPNLASDWGMEFQWVMWKGGNWWKVLGSLVLIIALTLSALSEKLKKLNMQKIYPRPDDHQEKQTSSDFTLSYDDLIERTLTLAEKMGVHVKAIFIKDSLAPNAFTTFLMDQGNIVVFHTNLLEILDEESVDAVIAHELGHIKEKDVLYLIAQKALAWLSLLWILGYIIKMMGLVMLSIDDALLMDEEVVIYRLILLAIGCGLFTLVILASNWMYNYYSRVKEKMADVYAVEFTSVEGMMNGLLRVNDRSHTLNTFTSALNQQGEVSSRVLKKALQNFPRGSKTEEEIKAKALQYYAQAQLEVFLTTLSSTLSEAQKEDIIDLLLKHRVVEEESDSAEDAKEEDADSTSVPSPLPFVWQDFDWNHDGELQLNELAGLIEALKQNPKALDDDEDSSDTHPSIRNRLLFLAELFEEELEQSQSSSS